MIAACGGGCCTPFPFEAAIWLLEEQEELYGGVFPVFGDVSPFTSPMSCLWCIMSVPAAPTMRL